MSGREFVDTNILVYAYDRSSGTKHERARKLVDQLWESGNGTVSTQVLQEFVVYLRHKVAHPLSAQETRRVLQDFMGWNVFVNTAQSILQALEIAERYQISFWDALIIQAAEGTGAEILYTEDLSHGQIYGDVRVVNPFK
jgi:predicted nucleic acid-binding protein